MDLQLKDDALSYEHVFSASVETVYQHFTDISLASQWMSPGNVQVKNLMMEPVAGGNFRLEMENPDGEIFTSCGTYSEVIPNKRLAYTWQWQHDENPVTYVEIDFIEVKEGCLMKFRHYGFMTSQAVEAHTEGWGGCMLKLKALLHK